jgi:hypothetical protein
MKKLVKSTIAILAAGLLSAGAATAQVVSFKDLAVDAVFTADRIDFGMGTPLPIPPGEWKLIGQKNWQDKYFAIASNVGMTRITLANTAVDADPKIVSISTNTERYNRFAKVDLELPIYGKAMQSYDLSESGRIGAYSYFSEQPDFAGFLRRLDPLQNGYGWAHSNPALVKPLLANPELLDRIGKNAVVTKIALSKQYAFQAQYTMISSVHSDAGASAGDGDLEAWVRAFTKVGIGLVSDTPAGSAPKHPRVTAEYLAQTIVAPSADAAPVFERADVQAAWDAFSKFPFPEDRVFVTSEGDTKWGWAAGAWPGTHDYARVLAGKRGFRMVAINNLIVPK